MKNKEMLTEYDFAKGKRGKYAKQYASGTNLIILDADVAKIFTDAQIVNQVLRALAKIPLHKKKNAA